MKLIAPNSIPASHETERRWQALLSQEIRFGKALGLADRQKLFHLLGMLLESGLSLLDSVEVLQDQFTEKKLRNLLKTLEGRLHAGLSLSESLAKDKDWFSPFEIYSLRMGEQTGRMSEILQSLAKFYEKRLRLRRKLTQALTYPSAVVVIALLVLGFMISYVVPMFQDIFRRFDAQLPPVTVFIMGLADIFQKWKWLLALGLVLIVAVFLILGRQPRFQAAAAGLLLRLPFIGPLVLKLHLSRFCYSFSLLLHAKVTLDRALELMEQITTFHPISIAISQIRTDVTGGSTLYEAFRSHQIFPPYLTQIVKVGEKTARLGDLIAQLGHNLEEESEAGIGQLTQFLEPVLIIVLGIMVAIILVAMYLPMFELSSAIQ